MCDGIVEVGKAKVDYFDVTGLGDKDVFNFEIYVNPLGLRGSACLQRRKGQLTAMNNVV